MSLEEIAIWVQVAVVLVTAGAVIAALGIASADRRHSARLTREATTASMRQARLLFEWEAAKRLSILEARGGHTDPVISKDMGAETLALIALLGPERVPEMWNRRVGKTDTELRSFIDDQSQPQFLRDSVEAERAVNTIGDEIRMAKPHDA